MCDEYMMTSWNMNLSIGTFSCMATPFIVKLTSGGGEELPHYLYYVFAVTAIILTALLGVDKCSGSEYFSLEQIVDLQNIVGWNLQKKWDAKGEEKPNEDFWIR